MRCADCCCWRAVGGGGGLVPCWVGVVVVISGEALEL
jgi:hypothetical protein